MNGPKTPLMLVPGLLCDAALWSHQIAHLSDIADIAVAETTRDDNLTGMARRILAAAPPRFALAGLSMGGYVCFEIMRQAPERVTRLALLDTAASPDDAARAATRRGLIELAEKGRFKGVTPRLMPMFVHPDRLQDEALTGAIMRMAESVGKDAFLRQQKAILGRSDSRPGLTDIDVPVMVVCGRQDLATPLESSEEIASLTPGARLCVIEECGHLSSMERPHAVTALMRDWLLRG
ncbi:MAG: alpha/beta fold hydrolase [Rhodospirillaceae bacterium]|jgi:pimeloyl-ACP methyl ester carboxylesterase|nr:alpha/beta fold hydrolase [Rhodospirillaceae bacterium]